MKWWEPTSRAVEAMRSAQSALPIEGLVSRNMHARKKKWPIVKGAAWLVW
ncbi:MAG: hypothetical protein V1934_02720 [Methanobacteriota archaeon]